VGAKSFLQKVDPVFPESAHTGVKPVDTGYRKPKGDSPMLDILFALLFTFGSPASVPVAGDDTACGNKPGVSYSGGL
jgi:hypothetical protein